MKLKDSYHKGRDFREEMDKYFKVYVSFATQKQKNIFQTIRKVIKQSKSIEE